MNNLKEWNTIPFQRLQHFLAYLAKIFQNFVHRGMDWKNTAKRNVEFVNQTEKIDLCISGRSGDRKLEAEEMGVILDSFLRTLTPQDQMVFLRRYWYVDTIAEIAARYGISESAVQIRLNRTKVKLGTCMKRKVHCSTDGKNILLGQKYVGDDLIKNAESGLFSPAKIGSAAKEGFQNQNY